MKKLYLLLISMCFTLLCSTAVMASPGKVTGVKQSGADTESIQITWNTVLGKDVYYDIQMSNDNINWNTVSGNYQSETDYKEYNLNSGTIYYVRVRARELTSTWDYTYGAWSDSVQVTTACEDVKDLTQKNATTSSITIAWSRVAGATSYKICRFVNLKEQVIGSTKNTYYTINGFNNRIAFPYDIYVKPVKAISTYSAEKTVKYSWDVDMLDAYRLKLVPGKSTAPKITHWWTFIGEADVEVNNVQYADGYQMEVYNAKGKKIQSSIMNSGGIATHYKYANGLKRNTFYKVRARAYNTIGASTKYGAWSDYTWFSLGVKNSAKRTSKKIKIRWDKVRGATNYAVYMSTQQKAGYRKVATTKKCFLNLKKFKKKKLKKKKTYYVYVVARKKVGKSVYHSDGHEIIISYGR